MDKISVGDFVMHQDPRGLFCGSGIYDMVVVASVDPLILVSEEGDMLWTNIEKANLLFAPRASLDDCPKAVIDRLSRELVMDRAIAADEIERLREENADLRSRLAEWVNLGNQYLFGNAVDNMVKRGNCVVSDKMLTEDETHRPQNYQVLPSPVEVGALEEEDE